MSSSSKRSDINAHAWQLEGSDQVSGGAGSTLARQWDAITDGGRTWTHESQAITSWSSPSSSGINYLLLCVYLIMACWGKHRNLLQLRRVLVIGQLQ